MQEAGSGHSWGAPALALSPGLAHWEAGGHLLVALSKDSLGPLAGHGCQRAVQGPRAATPPPPSARFWSWVCPVNGPLCPLRFWWAGKASGTMNPVSTLKLILGPAQKGSP